MQNERFVIFAVDHLLRTYRMLEHWTTILANIVTSLGILGFIGIYLSHQQSQAQFNFGVMLSCIERYQALTPIYRDDGQDDLRLRKYVDLTNEEFFYFQRKYIPKEVIVEWLDTIVEYFPVYVQGQDLPVNYDIIPHKKIHDNNLLAGYPRLKQAFTLRAPIDPANNVLLIKTVAGNVGIKLKEKHFRRAMCS